MNRLKEQIEYSKFVEAKSVTLDLDYAERLLSSLEELTHQPTFEQCIKEWEEDGWQIDILKQFPVIKIWRQNDNKRFIDEIIFYLKTLTYKIDFEADYEINNRIGKTLKALEGTKDE